MGFKIGILVVYGFQNWNTGSIWVSMLVVYGFQNWNAGSIWVSKLEYW